MPTISAPHGICSACIHESDCTYPRAAWPVTQCGEFESYFPAPPEPPPVLSRSVEEENSSPIHVGLCGSCVDRGICTYPKPPGGVWRCEDYR
jgi:hypothetical protein